MSLQSQIPRKGCGEYSQSDITRPRPCPHTHIPAWDGLVQAMGKMYLLSPSGSPGPSHASSAERGSVVEDCLASDSDVLQTMMLS